MLVARKPERRIYMKDPNIVFGLRTYYAATGNFKNIHISVLA